MVSPATRGCSEYFDFTFGELSCCPTVESNQITVKFNLFMSCLERTLHPVQDCRWKNLLTSFIKTISAGSLSFCLSFRHIVFQNVKCSFICLDTESSNQMSY